MFESIEDIGKIKVESFRVQLGGVECELLKWGRQKPDFIFIHGFGGSAGTFSKMITQLSEKGVGSISISLPWHGKSENPTDDVLFNIQKMGFDLADVLKKQFGVDSAHWIAHSLGVRLLLWIAVYQSVCIKTVHLMNPAGFYPWEIRFFSVFKKGLMATLLKNDFLAKHIVSFLVPHTDMRAMNAFRWYSKNYDGLCLHKTHVFMQLYKIEQPVHLYWGDSDRLLPVSVAFEVKQHFKNAEVHIIEHCGHLPMIQQVDKTTEILWNARSSI